MPVLPGQSVLQKSIHQPPEIQTIWDCLLGSTASWGNARRVRQRTLPRQTLPRLSGSVRLRLRTRFELSETEAESLVELARQEAADSSQLYGFTRVVKDHFSHEERVELVEMLWQVVYADGQKHDHEASLMRRVAGLIFVSDRECGSARKRALIKLGMAH